MTNISASKQGTLDLTVVHLLVESPTSICRAFVNTTSLTLIANYCRAIYNTTYTLERLLSGQCRAAECPEVRIFSQYKRIPMSTCLVRIYNVVCSPVL